jgi:cytochrome c peroxidase
VFSFPNKSDFRSLATLKEVIEYYNRGGNPNPQLDSEINPLRLTIEERRALRYILTANRLAG